MLRMEPSYQAYQRVSRFVAMVREPLLTMEVFGYGGVPVS